jgi:hypothetical protein
MSQNLPALVEGISPSRAPTPEMIADAMAAEKALVDELVAVMRRQRAAVAGNDLQALDDTVFATHRVLATLAQARRRRHMLNTLLGEREDLPLEALDNVLGARMTESLRLVRATLQESARVLSREVAVNRFVLKHAITSGDACLRVLKGTPGMGTATYSPESANDPRSNSLITRRA